MIRIDEVLIPRYGKLYCDRCGNKNELKRTGRYDGNTGLKIGAYVCVNSQCREFCESHGGHVWRGKFFGLFGSRCIRCGIEKSSYYWY